MATRLSKFDRPRPTRWIDWARFADGQIHRLTQGTDFDQDPRKAGRAARGWGERHGYQVTCQTDLESKSITLQLVQVTT